MASREPTIDAYIANSADFAKPILKHVRETVHAACPTADETIKGNGAQRRNNKVSAKTDATKQRRIDASIEWLEEGKSPNWKCAKA